MIVQALIDNLSSVVIGQEKAMELILVGLLADGHVLIEDVPGGNRIWGSGTLWIKKR